MAPPAKTGTKPQVVAPPARVRLWEVIAFQAIFAGCVGWRYDLFSQFPLRPEHWVSVLIHGAASALIVFAVGDLRLGDGARFSAPGRIAVIVCGSLGVYSLSIMYPRIRHEFGYYVDTGIHSFFGPFQGRLWLVAAMVPAGWNVLKSRSGRFLWRCVPLVIAILQYGSMWKMASFR